MMVRYLVLHLLARLLHIQLEGNGQDEEEGIKVDMRIKTKKKRRQEVNDGKVENTGGVAAEGWKKGWEEEEEKSVENWTTLIGLELGARLARLENFQVFIQDWCTGWHQEWKQAWKCDRFLPRWREMLFSTLAVSWSQHLHLSFSSHLHFLIPVLEYSGSSS